MSISGMFGLSIERPILDHHPKAHIHEIRWISWNLVDFRWNPWNPVDFMKSVKSGGFHPWNPVDFTHEIWQISCGFHPWNLVDFTQISPVKSTQNYKSKCFSKNSSVWWMQGGGFHPEIWWIDLWNPPKIIKASVSAKTLQFDECRVGDFTLEIWWISPWNLVDFNHEIWWISPRFHLWNPPKIIKASVSAKTLQFDECRVGAMTKDFTCQIQQSSPRFHLWNPPKIIKASVSAKTLQFDECKVGAMTKDFMKSTWNPPDFMKSGGFHVKSKDLLQGIVTLCLMSLAHNLSPLHVQNHYHCWQHQQYIGPLNFWNEAPSQNLVLAPGTSFWLNRFKIQTKWTILILSEI